MLRELTVRDLALIERARVAFGPGLIVITGETGAGKSLLIDALGLVMGERADSTLVRHGAAGARVEALFDLADRQEPLICVRELSAEGRSVARLDDETVTAGRLAAVVGPLIEVHGQHDQQRLLHGAWQRDVLDAFGGCGDLRQSVAELVGDLRSNEAALRELVVDPSELERRLELAQHAAEEIRLAAPRVGEVEELRQRLSIAGNAQRIASLLAEAHDLLAGEGRAARDTVARATRAATELARLDPQSSTVAERLANLEAELDDLAVDLSRRQDAMSDAAINSAAIEERLGVLYGLMRKYGQTEADVIEYGERAESEVARLRDTDKERARRQAESDRLTAAAHSAAAALHAARNRTATELARLVTDRLMEIGFPSAAFIVRLDEAPLDPTGMDAVTFLLAPNTGEPPRPLAKIASGGEMSRVALCLKSVLARADETPTLVFDEVDAGIGARSADSIGRLLRRLGRDHQVICITHLAQIAAYADSHLKIEKGARDGRTTTEVTVLDEDAARISELAQMLGGAADDAATKRAAAQLLDRAAAERREPVAAPR